MNVPRLRSKHAAHAIGKAMPPVRACAAAGDATTVQAPVVIPGSGPDHPPYQPAPRLAVAAQRRVTRHVITAVLIVTLLTCSSVTALGVTGYLDPAWLASSALTLVPAAAALPLDADHPRAVGAHAFLCAVLPWARYAQSQMTSGPLALPYPWHVSVILGQWGVEQGVSTPTYTGYNWGNVSAIPDFPSVPGTSAQGSPGRFAYARTASEGVAEWLAFSRDNHHYYADIARAYPSGSVAQAQALGRSPWDAAHYDTGYPGSLIVHTMDRLNLYQFDDPSTTC